MLRCPACDGPLASTPLGPLTIDTCEACGGAWFDRGELEAHLTRSATELSPTAPSPLPNERPAPPGRVWKQCPSCTQPMTPRNWEVRSGVIIDVCTAHGAWLDGGELLRVEGWSTSPKRQKAEARGKEAERLERSHASFGTATSARAETAARGGWFTPVLDLFSQLPRLFVD